MKRWYRPRGSVDAGGIMDFLSTHQHLHPHQKLGDALEQASQQCGFCPGAAEQSREWLQLDADVAIGRLRRSELQQLARSIYRLWQRQNLVPAQP